MHSISPVLTEAEVFSEQVIALEQEQYYPIIVARVRFADGSVSSMTRYRLSEEERAQVAAGADLILGQPHHGSMMPVSLALAMLGEYTK